MYPVKLRLIDLTHIPSQLIVDTLMDRRDMLHEYFLLEIDDHANVVSLPHLLKGYTPNLDKLPLFLMRLGPQVSLLKYSLSYLANALRR